MMATRESYVGGRSTSHLRPELGPDPDIWAPCRNCGGPGLPCACECIVIRSKIDASRIKSLDDVIAADNYIEFLKRRMIEEKEAGKDGTHLMEEWEKYTRVKEVRVQKEMEKETARKKERAEAQKKVQEEAAFLKDYKDRMREGRERALRAMSAGERIDEEKRIAEIQILKERERERKAKEMNRLREEGIRGRERDAKERAEEKRVAELEMKKRTDKRTAEKRTKKKQEAARMEKIIEDAKRSVDECCVCLDARIGTFIEPCRHAVACAGCVETLTTCPICRTSIENVVNIFLG